MSRGVLIVVEGIDGCGKSTLVANLHDHLSRAGHRCLSTFLPSDQGVGHLIRQDVLTGRKKFPPTANALLFAADRVAHYHNVIEPVLASGRHVLCDRGLWSMLSYQSYRPEGYEGEDKGGPLEGWLSYLTMFVPLPDLTLYLQLPIEEGLQRRSARSGVAKDEGTTYEIPAIQAHVAKVYDHLFEISHHREPIGTKVVVCLDARADEAALTDQALAVCLPIIDG